jgi:hypothetical protein
MKNIHVLPTDKPSRVYKHLGRELKHTVRYFEQKGLLCINQHIYITNDEEIKEGDYFWKPDCNMIFKAEYTPHKGCEKIILTTDHDLIKDGVQGIDDEFLEWFVKNPSCESVEVDKNWNYPLDKSWEYKIIIPKEEPTENCENCKQPISKYGCACGKQIEEPKQENCCTPIGQIKRYVDCIGCDRKPKQEENEIIDISDHDGIGNAVDNLNNEPPQETLEEAAYRLSIEKFEPKHTAFMLGVIEGAKWQAERMYSEEDLREAFKQSRQAKIFKEGMPPVWESFEDYINSLNKQDK